MTTAYTNMDDIQEEQTAEAKQPWTDLDILSDVFEQYASTADDNGEETFGMTISVRDGFAVARALFHESKFEEMDKTIDRQMEKINYLIRENASLRHQLNDQSIYAHAAQLNDDLKGCVDRMHKMQAELEEDQNIIDNLLTLLGTGKLRLE